MEKLTSEQVEMILKESNSHIKTNETLQQVFYELYGYKKLEEEMGCPLSIKCRICTDMFVYLPDGKAYLIVGVRDSYFRIKIDDGSTETVSNAEYGVSWWFKSDKTE